jgi:hypothetical protein
MQATKSLTPARVQPAASASSTRRARRRTIRGHAIRGILVLALAVPALVALAWPAHASAYLGHRDDVTISSVPNPWLF